ncbi:MAG TPA: glycosyl hydrolase family 8 [Polyangiaceae bacterium]|jgi:endo-1,4-beta-D-glucanase Y|nr:glycosyl hydrolase family 8 [Polyangiaceae bacterium]
MRHCLYTGGACMVLALAASACDAGASSQSDDEAGGSTSTTSQAGTGTSSSAGTAGAVSMGGSSSSAGSTGAAGAATNMIVMNPASSYPQNTAGAKYPYPQGHASTYCTFPIYNTDKVATAYTNWKTKFFQGGRVIRPENGNDTVSEGIAYGMLIGVYMNDKTMFDTLWAYAQTKFDSNGLMNWHLDTNGGIVSGGGATDADEDMAYALLMAGVQWGGTYATSAATLINAIWDHEVESGSNVLKPGDNFGGSSETDPSYFAPSYYRAFAKATPAHPWAAVVESSYGILGAASGADGLVPNWVNSSGAGVTGPVTDGSGPYFGYDACRIPFRIAIDYCGNGEPRAKAYMDKLVAFYNTAGGARLAALKDGYTTTGQNPPGALGDYGAGMAFYGPGGVAAMDNSIPAVLSGVYTSLVLNTSTTTSSSFTYFHGSWGTLSLLAMSGNFWDMTQ